MKIFSFLDATGSKRFILNVEVTPEHKPRPALPHTHTDNRIHRIGQFYHHICIFFKDFVICWPHFHIFVIILPFDCHNNAIFSGIHKDPTVIINKDDIETDPDTAIKNDIKERQRRSIFSQLGQWLCQGGGGGGREGCYSTGEGALIVK